MSRVHESSPQELSQSPRLEAWSFGEVSDVTLSQELSTKPSKSNSGSHEVRFAENIPVLSPVEADHKSTQARKSPRPGKGNRVGPAPQTDLRTCLEILETHTTDMLREVKDVIDNLPTILLWHLRPQQPTDFNYVNFVNDLLMSYQEGIGLLLIAWYQKRPQYIKAVYAKHERPLAPNLAQQASSEQQQLLKNANLLRVIEQTYARCASMRIGMKFSQQLEQSATPTESFYQALQMQEQFRKDGPSVPPMPDTSHSRHSIQPSPAVKSRTNKKKGKKGKKKKGGKKKKKGKAKTQGAPEEQQQRPYEPFVDLQTRSELDSCIDQYDRLVSCLQKCLLSVVDSRQVIDKWTCLCDHKNWVHVYDFLIFSNDRRSLIHNIDP